MFIIIPVTRKEVPSSKYLLVWKRREIGKEGTVNIAKETCKQKKILMFRFCVIAF